MDINSIVSIIAAVGAFAAGLYAGNSARLKSLGEHVDFLQRELKRLDEKIEAITNERDKARGEVEACEHYVDILVEHITKQLPPPPPPRV